MPVVEVKVRSVSQQLLPLEVGARTYFDTHPLIAHGLMSKVTNPARLLGILKTRKFSSAMFTAVPTRLVDVAQSFGM
jgi:hypothetical protein